MTIRPALSFGLLVAALAACSDPGPSVDPQAKAAICASLSRDYDAAVLVARECTLGAETSCSKTIPATLTCRCPTDVDGDIAPPALIAGHYSAEDCFALSPCVGACSKPMPGIKTCAADPTSSTGRRCL